MLRPWPRLHHAAPRQESRDRAAAVRVARRVVVPPPGRLRVETGKQQDERCDEERRPDVVDDRTHDDESASRARNLRPIRDGVICLYDDGAAARFGDTSAEPAVEAVDQLGRPLEPLGDDAQAVFAEVLRLDP